RRPWLVRHWWLLPLSGCLVVAPLVWGLVSGVLGSKDPLPGYISDPSRLEAEYKHYVGHPLQDTPSMQRFDQATQFMLSGNYSNAAIVLEDVSKKIPVPAVFNDIGI